MSAGGSSGLGPLKPVAIAAVAALAVAAFAFRKTLSHHPELGLIAVAALLLLTLALGIYTLVKSRIARKHSTPFAGGLMGLLRGRPGGLSPEEIAELDRLDKSFEEGIEVFRRAGKNVYELPWYIFVGEPGSGKTEAIRRAGIPSPSGLNDPLQGVGGTINMNWWFNNHAVLIDTAGKMMFKSAAPGKTTEWKRFLEWLRKARKKRPITGMFLVIPADTLITDSPEQIEAKAGTIAERFDGVQRALGIRFPVYVLVTKCDKIPGFRDFFADLSGPGIQEQLVGWSNPELERFEPQAVVKHLQSVQKRMLARRRMLLLDPVRTDDPAGRRLDQVDSLYEFPEALMRLSPRLTRYLETIFTQGAWSALPLFLRGIYFTSSRQEGEECDKAIADLLGVGVDQLRGGSHWAQERGMFLRDAFLTKAFKELGLVSRAANVRSARRRAMAGVLGVACVAVGGLFALGWHWKASLESDLERYANAFGQAAAMAMARDPAHGHPPGQVIDVIAHGSGDFLVYLDAEEADQPRRRYTLLRDLAELSTAGAAPKVPGVFRFFRAGPDARDRLRIAAAQAFELSLLGQVVDSIAAADPTSVAERLRDEAPRLVAEDNGQQPTPLERSRALGALAQASINADPAGVEPKPLDLTSLLAVALADSDEDGQAAWREHAPDFERLRDELGARGRLPVEHHEAVAEVFDALAAALVEGSVTGEGLDRFQSLRDAADRFASLDAELQAIARDFAADEDGAQHPRLTQRWDNALTELTAAADAITAAGLPSGASARAQCERALAEAVTVALANLQPLLAVDPRRDREDDSPQWGDWFDGLRAAIDTFSEQSRRRSDGVTSALGLLDADLLAPAADDARVYQVRAGLYASAAALLRDATEPQPRYAPGAIALRVEAVSRSWTTTGESPRAISDWRSRLSEPQRQTHQAWIGRQESAATAVVNAAERSRFIAWLTEITADVPPRMRAFADGAEPMPAVEPAPLPELPLTGGRQRTPIEFALFHPGPAASVLADLRAIRALAANPPLAAQLGAQSQTKLAASVREAEAALSDYMRRYSEHWSSDAIDAVLAIRPFQRWSEFHEALAAEHIAPVQGHSAALDEFLKQSAAALRIADPQSPAGTAIDRLRRAYTDRFDSTCTAAMEEWMALPADASLARGALASLSAAEFRSRYLTPLLLERQAGASDALKGYWSQVILAGLAALADSYEREWTDPLHTLRADGLAAFPLYRLSSTDLDAARIEQAKAALNSALSSGPDGSVGRVGGAAVADTPVAPLLDRLKDRVPAGAAATQLPAMGQIAAALTSDTPLRAKVRTIPFGEAPQSADPFAGIPSPPGCCDVAIGPRPRDTFNVRAGREYEAAVSGPDVPAVEFQLNRGQTPSAAPAGDPVRFSGPWGLLSALRHPDAASRTPTVWHVPLDFTVDGKPCRYWVQLEFSAPLPAADQWPRHAEP